MHKHEIILTDDNFAELEIEAELLGKKYVEALHEQKARQGHYILRTDIKMRDSRIAVERARLKGDENGHVVDLHRDHSPSRDEVRKVADQLIREHRPAFDWLADK